MEVLILLGLLSVHLNLSNKRMPQELKDPVFINFLGEVPVNPDDLPERRYFVGRGSDRPVGLSFDRMHFYYWNVRTFRFSIFGFLPPRDLVGDFLMGSGGGLNASAGLANVAIQGSSLPEAFSSSGFTTIKTVSRIKNRIKDRSLDKAKIADLSNINLAQKPDPSRRIPGDPNGPYAEKVFHSIQNKDNGKTGAEYRPVGVNEASLVAAGPRHRAVSQGTSVIIDFSDVIYFNYRYWPRIMVFTPWGTSFIGYTAEYETEYGYSPPSFRAGFRGLTSPFAFVSFEGFMIPITYAQELQLGQTGLRGIIGPVINGNITSRILESEECCSRFYYDNSDEYRKKKAGECKGCDRQGVGLKV